MCQRELRLEWSSNCSQCNTKEIIIRHSGHIHSFKIPLQNQLFMCHRELMLEGSRNCSQHNAKENNHMSLLNTKHPCYCYMEDILCAKLPVKIFSSKSQTCIHKSLTSHLLVSDIRYLL
jgi:hypothetical protein